MQARLIVSSSGIRGVVGRSLDPATALRFAAAYGTLLARDEGGVDGHLLMGRDSRVSGPVLADAVAAGLRAVGWSVRDAGVVATPTGLLAVQDDPEARGGVLVTASHNPPEWNGLKLATAGGEFVSPGQGEAVSRILEEGPAWSAWDGQGGRSAAPGAVEHHVERILGLEELVDPGAVADADLTVAVDAVRGAGGPVMTRLLEAMGCRVEGLDLEPDGRFPRDPEPRPENLERLGDRVRSTGADLGLAVDPDTDRLALVDGTGRPVGEDLTLALAARYVLRRRPGPVVTNLSTSRVVRDVAEAAGCELHLAPVGEANVAARMREVEAVVGGEGNGGVMLPALHLTRDAPLASALILSGLAREGASLGEAVAALPVYHIAKSRAGRPEAGLAPVYDALASAAGDGARADRQDGLRLDWPGDRRWVHVRPSGTEPIVRIIAEAPEAAEAERLVAWARERMAAALSGD
jgi:phosphomannomutase